MRAARDWYSVPGTDAQEAIGGALLSRRGLLIRAGAGAGIAMSGGLLTACGDSGPATSGSGKVGGELNVYTWEGFDAPDAMARWRRRNDVTVKASYIGLQDDVQARVKSPAGRGIDISSVNQGYVGYYKELGILSPISDQEVPALKGLYPYFARAPWRNADGTFNCVPWSWAIIGLTYSPERMERPESWDVLFEPRLKGRVTMFDDPQQNVMLAAIILGHNPDRLTHEQLDEVKEWLARLRGQVKTFSPTTGDQVTLLASGEIDAVFLGWNGIDQFIKEKNARAETVVPREGGMGACDSMFIPPESDNRATALSWCQTLMTGKPGAAAYDSVAGGATTPEVVPLLAEATRELFPYDDLAPLLDRLTFPRGYPRGESEFVTLDEAVAAWEEVKAG